ncbi:MAG: glycosyltransferase family 4 protein [Deltaproteobacteria bacterium]|nr:MAG: glycosyltransferase family 4 protein [Deltaproteobacteria bacterium]
MNPMRIAMVGTKGIPAKWGGIEKYIEEVGKILAKKGHFVTVFGSKWYCADYHQNKYLGMNIRTVPSLHFKSTDALTNGLFASVAALKGHYDVINFHGYASYYFIPLVQRLGKIAVVTAHGAESGWDNPKYGTVARKIIKQAFKLGITHADRVTTVANHLQNTIKKTFNVDASVLPSGLDEVHRLPARLINEKYNLNGLDYLLFLGRIDPIKRVDWIFDLTGVLREDLKIVIAGGSQDSAMDSYFQQLVHKSKGDAAIIFTGAVSGIEKAELLSNCLLFLAPSSYEGLPITVLEAVAYGSCCVASDIPAHSEIIEDGVTGYLFPRNDRSAFVRLIYQLIAKHKDRLASIGSQAKIRSLQKLNWENTSTSFEQLFRSLLDEKRKF